MTPARYVMKGNSVGSELFQFQLSVHSQLQIDFLVQEKANFYIVQNRLPCDKMVSEV